MCDLRAELEVAALLLNDERFALEYETYAAAKQRGPDFSVTFRTNAHFNVEVRRIRGAELGNGGAEARVGKLMEVVCDKAGQMPPSIVNLLWLVSGGDVTVADLTRAAATLRQLAEGKADDFFTRRGFGGAADFLRQFQRLSAVVLRQSGRNVTWLNSLARHKAPLEIVVAIQRL